MVYGLNEGLRVIAEEGLQERFVRHRKNASALWAGLEALGLELLVEPAYRLPSLTSVKMPEGVDEAAVRRRLMDEYSIEVGSGLGDLKGKIIRIGLMGSGSNRKNIVLFLSALGEILSGEGFRNDVGTALSAALKVLEKE